MVVVVLGEQEECHPKIGGYIWSYDKSYGYIKFYSSIARFFASSFHLLEMKNNMVIQSVIVLCMFLTIKPFPAEDGHGNSIWNFRYKFRF